MEHDILSHSLFACLSPFGQLPRALIKTPIEAKGGHLCVRLLNNIDHIGNQMMYGSSGGGDDLQNGWDKEIQGPIFYLFQSSKCIV